MSTRNNARERLQRGNPAEQPRTARTVSGDVRVKPTRITVDLQPNDYEILREFAHQQRIYKADIMRGLVRLLENPDLTELIRAAAMQ